MDRPAIENIRRVDIVALIQKTVPLRPKGRAFVGRCPFHPDEEETLSVNREKGFFYCFGCKTKGTAFDFVMKTEGVTRSQAAAMLFPLG